MEAKLKEYRALRRRNELIDNAKDKIEKSKDKLVQFLVPKMFRDMGKQKEEEVLLMENEEDEEQKPVQYTQRAIDTSEVMSEVSEAETLEEENPESWRYCIVKYSVYAIIWFSLFIYFVTLQFGAVYFVITVLIGIYLNTRTRPRKKGEVSAYSVFNENCASIDGTLTAEQLQKEMMYGPLRLF